MIVKGTEVLEDGTVKIGKNRSERIVEVTPAGIVVWARQKDEEGSFDAIVDKYDRAPLNPATDGWRASAACRGLPTALWFPLRGESSMIGKAVCALCPVAEQCLADADRPISQGYTRVRWGTWGGKSERARRGPRETAPHGTLSRYQAACRCEPCTDANTRESARRRRAKLEKQRRYEQMRRERL